MTVYFAGLAFRKQSAYLIDAGKSLFQPHLPEGGQVGCGCSREKTGRKVKWVIHCGTIDSEPLIHHHARQL
ncbi:hypothetical protein JT06_04240 [Desulfobulbus sp. Tol-SR]|nr:hypothetical protein JT06_04240 [Desulfobulbus sp. Tol-SR]